MAQLIGLKAFNDFSGNAYSPSKTITINVDNILSVEDTTGKLPIPGVNSYINVNYKSNNVKFNGQVGVNETVDAIVTLANA